MRFVKIIGVCFMVVFIGSMHLTFQAPSSYTETTVQEDQYYEFQAPRMERTYSLEGKWFIQLSTTIMLLKTHFPVATKVHYELTRLGLDGNTIYSMTPKSLLMNKVLTAQQLQRLTIDLGPLERGQYALDVEVTHKLQETSVSGEVSTLLFTVQDSDVIEGWNEPTQTEIEDETNIQLKWLTHSQSLSSNEWEYPWMQSPNNYAFPLKYSTRLQSEVMLTGKWMITSRKGEIVPVQRAQVELRYRDSFYRWIPVAVTTTDYDGSWHLTYEAPFDANLWEVRVSTKNPEYGEVQKKHGTSYMETVSYYDLRAGGNIGKWKVKENTLTQLAFWSFNDMIRGKDLLRKTKDPGNATIVLDPTKTSSSFYRHGGKIVLRRDAPENITTTLHELGHLWMYNLYGSMPAQICPRPHNFFKPIEDNGKCSWLEAWASLIPLVVNDTSRFYYSPTHFTDLEDTSNYKHQGELVEGRVLAALWDLYDNRKDGLDTRSYPFSFIYLTMSWDKVYRFSDFWDKWKAYGFDPEAKYSLWQNSIFFD